MGSREKSAKFAHGKGVHCFTAQGCFAGFTKPGVSDQCVLQNDGSHFNTHRLQESDDDNLADARQPHKSQERKKGVISKGEDAFDQDKGRKLGISGQLLWILN